MSQLELSIKPQRGALIEGQANVLHALVSVSAPDAPMEKVKRTPLNLMRNRPTQHSLKSQ